jgi:hypothetical protein
MSPGGRGGRHLRGIIEDNKQEIRDYFGAINLAKATSNFKKIPEKPAVLVYYEQCKALRVPLVAGGLMDQPYVWLEQYAACDHVVAIQNLSMPGQQNFGSIADGI